MKRAHVVFGLVENVRGVARGHVEHVAQDDHRALRRCERFERDHERERRAFDALVTRARRVRFVVDFGIGDGNHGPS